MSALIVDGESLKTPFGFGKLLSIREASTELPECGVVQLSFGTAYLSLSSIGVNSSIEKKSKANDNEKEEEGDNDNDEDVDDDDDEVEEEETTPSKSSNRFGSKVAAARTKKLLKARENYQRRVDAAAAAAAAAGENGSNFIVELEEGDDDGEDDDDDDYNDNEENVKKSVKTPKSASIKSPPSSSLSPRTPASQQARSPTLLPATTVSKGTPSGSNAPMTEAKRALAEAKRAELLLRSPVMQKQPRELTEAQKAALASKGVLKELVAENDLGSGGGGNGGGTGVLEAIAAVEVGEGLGGLLSTAAAITVVGVCVGGLYMMMRRR
jgi:hypothetical protein